MSEVYREFEAKMLEVRVAEINTPFNYGAEVNIYKN